jgi:pimeloyl-ACP methyl ester carboxylesterase
MLIKPSLAQLKFGVFSAIISISACNTTNDKSDIARTGTNASACDADIVTAVQAKMQKFETIYHDIDGRTSKLKPGNESVFMPGSNGRAILLQHGFMASPFEVQSLANHLHGLGFSVYSPLLYGFGSSPKVANKITGDEWHLDFAENFEILKKCYNKIGIIGFSIGANLSLQFTLDHAPIVQSLALISPYYGLNNPFFEDISGISILVPEEISPQVIYDVSGADDLKAIVKFPDFYNTSIPVTAAREVVELGHQIKLRKGQQNFVGGDGNLNIPNLTIFSEHDATIDIRLARELPEVFFKTHQITEIPVGKKVPHQVLLPDLNSHLSDILTQIGTFESQ